LHASDCFLAFGSAMSLQSRRFAGGMISEPIATGTVGIAADFGIGP